MRSAVRFLAVLFLAGSTVVGAGPAGAQSPSAVPAPSVRPDLADPSPGTGGTVPGVLDWESVAPPMLGSGRGYDDLVAWGRGFAMTEVDAKGRTRAIWSSPDGRGWARSELPRPLGQTWSFGPWRGGLLLVAETLGREQGFDGFTVQTWWSRDASRWTQLGRLDYTLPAPLVRSSGCQVNHEQVLPMADRIVVLAAVCQDACCGFGSPADGPALAMLGPARRRGPATPTNPIGWTSLDGAHWSRRHVKGIDGYLQVTAVGADRILGITGGFGASLLESQDGLIWTRAGDLPDRLDNGGQLLLALAGGAAMLVGESFADEGGYGNTMHLWRVEPGRPPVDTLRRQPAFTHSLVVDGSSVWLVGNAWGDGPSADSSTDDTAWAWLMGSPDGGTTWPEALRWTGSDGSCLGELAIHGGTAAMTACVPDRLGTHGAVPKIPALWVAVTSPTSSEPSDD